MEDTLRDIDNLGIGSVNLVLILVLMEDTLRDSVNDVKNAKAVVLILVLMEDTLRATNQVTMMDLRSLNPCSNGRYSQRRAKPKNP